MSFTRQNSSMAQDSSDEEGEPLEIRASKKTRPQTAPEELVSMEDYAIEEEARKLRSKDGTKMVKAAEVTILNEGDVNRVPLAVAQDGNRIWARRRDPPFTVQYTDVVRSSQQVVWVDTGSMVSAGPHGATRCAAFMGYFVMQRHQDGRCVYTDGNSLTVEFYLHWDRDDNCIRATSVEDAAEAGRTPTDFAVCTAMACVGRGLGFAAVIEDYGLIYVNMTKFVYDSLTVIDLDTSAGSDIVTSIGVCANLVAYCIGNQPHEYSRHLVICNVLEPSSKAHIPVPQMIPVMHNDDDEKIWQLSLGPNCASIVTTERCLWIDLESKLWKSSTTTGVLASSISPLSKNLVFLTVLGDCFFVHINGKHLPQRLQENSEVQPFASCHTRDGLIAWGTDNGPMNECVRMVKAGAQIQQVSPQIQSLLKNGIM